MLKKTLKFNNYGVSSAACLGMIFLQLQLCHVFHEVQGAQKIEKLGTSEFHLDQTLQILDLQTLQSIQSTSSTKILPPCNGSAICETLI